MLTEAEILRRATVLRRRYTDRQPLSEEYVLAALLEHLPSPEASWTVYEANWPRAVFDLALDIVRTAGIAQQTSALPDDAPRTAREARVRGLRHYLNDCSHHGPDQRYNAANWSCLACVADRKRQRRAAQREPQQP